MRAPNRSRARARLLGFSFLGIEIDSLISVGHFSSMPIAIPISISIIPLDDRDTKNEHPT